MRKIIITLGLIIVFFIAFIQISYAEMAKEGTISGKGYYNGNIQMLPMGKERVQINYEVCGISVSDNKESIFHNSSQYVLGGLHVVNGNIEDSGFIESTLTNGDKVFMTYKASGKMGKPTIYKGTFSFVGGTGKVNGIQGGGEFTRYSLQPPAKGKSASFSVRKGNWKIVEAKE
ncbi:MAG: hypothetical protein ABFS35_23605 [Bacteroidota bacterium]